MLTAITKSVPINFAGWDHRGAIPRWASELNCHRATLQEILQSEHLSGVIVVTSSTIERFGMHKIGISGLGDRVRHSNEPCRIVVNFDRFGARGPEPERVVDVMRLFPGDLAPRIELSWGKENLRTSLYEALAKHVLEEEIEHLDPLAEAREILAATRPLLDTNSQRLSAKLIAHEFKFSVNRLAELIGRSRQTISKTPDSPKIQIELRPFERIFRLRSELSAEDFTGWLEMPNSELDDLTPKSVIESGKTEIVANLVEDMLLGTPS